MSSVVRPIRIAARSLTRTPVVTIAAIVSLALGLGALDAPQAAVLSGEISSPCSDSA